MSGKKAAGAQRYMLTIDAAVWVHDERVFEHRLFILRRLFACWLVCDAFILEDANYMALHTFSRASLYTSPVR